MYKCSSFSNISAQAHNMSDHAGQFLNQSDIYNL